MMRKPGIYALTGLLILLVSIVFSQNASGWIVSEYHDAGSDEGGSYTTTWYRVENNSFDDIIGFAVAVNPTYSSDYETLVYAPMGSASPVGDWEGAIVDSDAWDYEVINDLDYPPLTRATFFGYSWNDSFGHYGYNYAYVALPWGLFEDPYANGRIPAGQTYGSDEIQGFDPNSDFGFKVYTGLPGGSPVIAMFEGKGGYLGETGADNTNPVPLPASLILFGSGLLPIAGSIYRKAKNRKIY